MSPPKDAGGFNSALEWSRIDISFCYILKWIRKNSKLETILYMKKLEVYIDYQNEDLEETLLHCTCTVLAGKY